LLDLLFNFAAQLRHGFSVGVLRAILRAVPITRRFASETRSESSFLCNVCLEKKRDLFASGAARRARREAINPR
jgi:hypothetical protein